MKIDKYMNDNRTVFLNYAALSVLLMPLLAALKLTGVLAISWTKVVLIPILVPLGVLLAASLVFATLFFFLMTASLFE